MTATTPARSGVSPSSSPRLPSPPPIPEVQYGPQSPSISTVNTEVSFDSSAKPDEGAARRIRPGTKAADMASGPPLVPLNQLDSAFQLQEHLKALYSNLTHTPSSTHTIPITQENAIQMATPPQINENETVDKNLWLYELCRFLVLKANIISCALMVDTPPCSSLTCPEMRASEWQYLCAVHEPPKSCCAIDYCNHTLDWAANVLTSPKHFPSRLALGGDSGNVLQSMRQLTNIFRRVYRIFAHAWFQHRDVFWTVEGLHGLYMFFKTVCDEYELIGVDNYTIPAEASGPRDDGEASHNKSSPEAEPKMQVLRNDTAVQPKENGHKQGENQSTTTTTISTGATTRRHKHTPSTGSHVAPIAEGQEDEDEIQVIAATPATNNTSPTNSNQQPSTPDRAIGQGLGRLDISNTVPKYVPEAPSDPTPTTATPDRDPMASAARRNSGFEDEVTSPSGGSIRTGGPDVLNAILGHMDELDYQAEDRNDLETAVVEDDTSILDAAQGSDKDNVHGQQDHEVGEDDNELMERIEVPIGHSENDVDESHEQLENSPPQGDKTAEQDRPAEIKTESESAADNGNEEEVNSLKSEPKSQSPTRKTDLRESTSPPKQSSEKTLGSPMREKSRSEATQG